MYWRRSNPCPSLHDLALRNLIFRLRYGTRLITFALVCATGFITSLPATVTAQVQSGTNQREVAVRLRNAGDFAGAVKALRSHLASYPDDGDALRLLAQTLYWLQDFSESRAAYENALSIHPEDTELRLQYAQMLIETGDGNRARDVLAGLGSQETHGRVDAILGTLAYWEGDLARAEDLLSSAIASGDTDPAIRRIHTDIAVMTAPWAGMTPAYQHDDQPITRSEIGAEAGWFPSSSTSIKVTARGLRFALGDTANRNVSLADVALSHYAAAAHTELELGGGAVARSFGSSVGYTARAAVSFRLPAHFKLGARGERSPYFNTEASLSQNVVTNTVIGFLSLDDPRGWLGETAYQAQRYEDANTVMTGYAWLLAPLIHSSTLDIRAGYAASLQNSSESRFTLAHPSQPYLPSDPRFDMSGVYSPYYTPIDLQSHSAIAAMTARSSNSVIFNAGGSYAFYATETAPVFLAITTTTPPAITVQRRTYTRNFNPWNAHASLELNPSASFSLVASGETFRTGFYAATGASVGLIYHFADHAIKAAGGY